MPAVVPRPFAESRKLFEDELMRLARESHLAYCRDLTTMYLVGEKRSGNYAIGYYDLRFLRDYEDLPDGVEYIINEHIPRDRTVEQLYFWFRDHLRNTPMWCFCD